MLNQHFDTFDNFILSLMTLDYDSVQTCTMSSFTVQRETLGATTDIYDYVTIVKSSCVKQHVPINLCYSVLYSDCKAHILAVR